MHARRDWKIGKVITDIFERKLEPLGQEQGIRNGVR